MKCFNILFLLMFFGQLLQAQVREKSIEEVKFKVTKNLKKKDNPAYAILQEVWKRKKSNGLARYRDYRYDEYEKVQIDLANLDSVFTQKKIFNKLEFIFKYADTANGPNRLSLPVFFNETIYTTFGRNTAPKRENRKVIANKTSGFSENDIIANAAKNLYKDINIYDDMLNFFNIGFTGPVARDGFAVYDYQLLGEEFIEGTECYRIRYSPKREDVLSIFGVVYISKETYAVVRATIKSSREINVNFVNSFYYELEFNNPSDSVFLPKRNYQEIQMSLFGKKEKSKSIIARKTSVFSDYQFNQDISDEDLKETVAALNDEQFQKDDDYWATNRKEKLSGAEVNVHKMMTELQDVPKFKRVMKLAEVIQSGYYNVKNAVDIGDIYSVVGFNEVEGFRLRVGARTYFTPNDMWRAAFYTAYGFRDDQLKYGMEFRTMLTRESRFTLGIGTRRDVLQLGSQLTADEGIMTRSFASSGVFNAGENFSLSSVNQSSAFASIDPLKNLTLRLDVTNQTIKSALPEKFSLDYIKDGMRHSQVNDSRMAVSITAKPGAQFTQYGLDRHERSTLSPTLSLKYTQGMKGVLGSDFNYSKLQFFYLQPMLIKSLGRLVLNFEAGQNFGTLPLALQNIIPGNQTYNIIPNTFALLNYYEFTADRYATFSAEHHFNGKILSYIPLIRKLKLREVAFFRTAVGSLDEKSVQMNAPALMLKAPEKPYYEYGFGIENIGFGNVRILRFDFNWRGNYLDAPETRKFGVQFGLQFYF